MSTTQFIDELAAGNASGAKDILNDMLSARAFEALEGRKVEIAQNIFNGSQVQEEEEEVEITQEEFDQLDELSKNTLRSYLKGSKAEAGSQLRGDVSDKAASLGRTQQDKDDARYEGGKLAKRKLGAPGSIPPKVMAK
jgi:hypothetical protein